MTELSESLRDARLPKLVGETSSTAIIVVVTVAALYVGRDVFIPLALAVLVSFMLTPLVSLLQRRRVPRAAAVIGVVAITFAAIFGFGFVVAGQVTRRAMVVDGIATLIENLSDAEDGPPAIVIDLATAVGEIDALPAHQAFGPTRGQILCIGGRGNLDDAAAAILSQLLGRRGLRSRALSWIDVNPANLGRIDTAEVRVVCLAYLNKDSSAHARYLVRRLRRRMPGTSIVVSLLASVADPPGPSQTQPGINADVTSTSFIDTLDKIGVLVAAPSGTPPSTLPVRLVV